MKKKVMLFVKGMILGAAMIIPGLSGGTLAISMGLYEKIIKTVSHFFEDFKKNFKFALNLGLGAVVSIGICILILDYIFEHFPVPAILLFIGLIIGSVPSLLEEANFKSTIKFSNLIFILLGAFIIIGLSLLKINDNMAELGAFSFLQSTKLFGVGIVAAGTIVVPGISGSLILMVMGYYQPLLTVISEVMKLQNLTENILILLPFGVGIIVGGIAIVKIIEYLFKKHKTKTYYSIIGFLIASIVEVFLGLFKYQASVIQVIMGIVLLIIGIYLSLKVLKND